MTINRMLEKLKAIKESEGGDIEVFLSVGNQDSVVHDIQVERAEHLVDEHIFLGHCEEYHQCVLIKGN